MAMLAMFLYGHAKLCIGAHRPILGLAHLEGAAPFSYHSATEGYSSMGCARRALRWLAFGLVGAPLAVLRPPVTSMSEAVLLHWQSPPFARGGVTLSRVDKLVWLSFLLRGEGLR
jgi:hypothetical protein